MEKVYLIKWNGKNVEVFETECEAKGYIALYNHLYNHRLTYEAVNDAPCARIRVQRTFKNATTEVGVFGNVFSYKRGWGQRVFRCSKFQDYSKVECRKAQKEFLLKRIEKEYGKVIVLG